MSADKRPNNPRKRANSETTPGEESPKILDEQSIEAIPELKNLPPKVKQQVIRVIQKKSHSGPIPDPESIEHYDRIIPNGADRIMRMAEKQIDRSIESDREKIAIRKIQVEGEVGSVKRGQIFGFVIGLVCILISCLAAYLGEVEFAKILGGTTVVSLVIAFITGKIFESKKE